MEVKNKNLLSSSLIFSIIEDESMSEFFIRKNNHEEENYK
jgi:hypothetical protein